MPAAFLLFLLLGAAIVALALRDRRRRFAAEAAAAQASAHQCRAERDAKIAYERLHAVSNSALRGAPVVKWSRPQPVAPGADAWYWRVRVAGEDLLITDEQFRIARHRAAHLLARPDCSPANTPR